MNKHQSSRHTFLFRVVSTIVLALILLGNLAAMYPKKDSPFGKFVKQVSALFFDSSTRPPLRKSGYTTAGSDTSNGRDPSYPPKPNNRPIGP